MSVHYVGVAHSTGEEFDASYNRGAPLDFRLGVGQVISGWDQGVQGMKVGGRRRLVIPPHLAYGDRGAGGVIEPGETLIFVVDLVGVQLTSGTTGSAPSTTPVAVPRATERHHVAGHELATAAGLDRPVDGDQPLDHQLLGVGAGVDQVGQLEELTEPDRLVADRHVVHASRP